MTGQDNRLVLGGRWKRGANAGCDTESTYRMIKTSARYGMEGGDVIEEDGSRSMDRSGKWTKGRNEREYLTLNVVRPSQEQERVEIHFRVKQTTQMVKLKRSYSERNGGGAWSADVKGVCR